MINYKLIVAYDGSKYNGFQRQSKHPEKTIQGKIEAVLSQLFETPIQIIGSGRTDAGVHSKGQTCNFHVERSLSPEEIWDYLITYLPKDIAVLSVSIASPRFHSRYNVVKKHYIYTIDNNRVANPFHLRYAYHVPQALNLEAMEKAAHYLLGTHDFNAFTSLKSKTKSTVRSLTRLELEQKEGQLLLHFEGDGFLQHMVRIISGTLIEVGLGERSPESIEDILNSQLRSNAGATAPAHGLCMAQVTY